MKTAQKPRERFFTVQEVAEAMGVSDRTVRRWIADENLVAHRFGRTVRIAESELKAFIGRHAG
jgi:excisionase family DNA binding protein